MPGRKLTALCYGSVSAISNRVTDVTCDRSAGTRQRQQGKKCSKNLCRCRSCDIENGFDREDVLMARAAPPTSIVEVASRMDFRGAT
jgi:hypothetical protein